MAIEHADSFDIYGTNASLMTDGIYAEATFGFGGGPATDPDGLSTQRAIFFNGGVLRYPLQSPVNIVGMARRVWCPALPGRADAEPILFFWTDIDNELIAAVKVQTNGAIKFEVVGGDTFSTNVPVITAEAWWHVECRIEVNMAGAGKFELRVENNTVIEEEDLDFNRGTVYQCCMGGETGPAGHTGQSWAKDLVIWNTLGTDNVDFLGPVRVMNLTPDSDDELGGWVPSTGALGYPILDNNPPLDTEFLIGAPTAVDDPMAFGLTNLPDDITSIKAVLTFVRARKVDGGYGKMQTSMIGTASAESPGADRPITAGYVYWRDVHERDPGTDTAWTRVAVNSSKVKMDRTL